MRYSVIRILSVKTCHDRPLGGHSSGADTRDLLIAYLLLMDQNFGTVYPTESEHLKTINLRGS